MKHLKLFEDIDPFGEEEWEEKELVVRPLECETYDKSGYAYVGEMIIGSYHKVLIDRKYHVKVGFDKLEYDGSRYKTTEEAKKRIENWWKEIINKITY